MTNTDERIHIKRTGTVDMALSAVEAFSLFNAEGERRWVAGWNPRYVYSDGPSVGEGVVFQTTRSGGATETWVQTRHDPAAGFASFVRVVPDHHVATVDVDVKPAGELRSQATVTYRMISLSSDGDEFVRAFDSAFEDFMAHWAEAIQRHVVEGVPLDEERP